MINKSFNAKNRVINIKAKICDNNEVLKHMNYEYFTGMCRDGCPHYNKSWSCPPNSPTYENYSRKYNKSLVIILYSKLDKEDISDVHKHLRKEITPILDKLEEKFNGLKTDGGRCMICEECSYVHNKKCYHPHLLRHSMEAMGINLDTLSKEILDHSITWGNDEDSYCTVFGSVLFNGDVSEKEFDIQIKFDNR